MSFESVTMLVEIHDNRAPVPTKGYPTDAGFDLALLLPSNESELQLAPIIEDDAACCDGTLQVAKSHLAVDGGERTLHLHPGERVLLNTGIKVKLPPNHYARIVHRSSTEWKKGLTIVEATIDNSYVGPLLIHVKNLTNKVKCITSGDKLAQLIVTKQPVCDISVVDSLPETDRGANGFGSTGG